MPKRSKRMTMNSSFISLAAIFAMILVDPPSTSAQSPQPATLTAAGTANPAKSAAFSPVVNPTSPELAPGGGKVSVVSVSVSPKSTSLNGGQSATFTAKVTGSSITTVTWSLSPQVGTIVNGVYQAPATIATQQSVSVIAMIVADSTKCAIATVTLNPVAVTLSSSGSTSLNGGASVTFTAKVSD